MKRPISLTTAEVPVVLPQEPLRIGVPSPAHHATSERPFAPSSSRPIVDSFLSWCDAEIAAVLDGTPIADGIRYARNQRIIRFF